MPYSAAAVANEFIIRSLADDDRRAPVTNMKLQKLVYLAHGYSLGLFDLPLVSNDIHAFEWGPVIPVLYNELKQYGANQVPNVISGKRIRREDVGALSVVDSVWKAYGHFDGIQLSRITHKPNTPWSETWAKTKHGVIPDAMIRGYYQKLLHERRGIRAA